ncbi:MAG: hypothetical protein IK115_06850 [Lachnospiraceae bacterium]|nr:hypothetical protein [Lachnospiraceae bacterium]
MKKLKRYLKPNGEWDRDRLSSVIVDAVLIIAAVILFCSYGIRFHSDPVNTSGGWIEEENPDRYADVKLFDNVAVGSVDVSGLTVKEAKRKVRSYVDSVLDTPFELEVAGKHRVPTSLRQMGLEWTNPEAIDEVAAMREGLDPIRRYTLGKDLEQQGITVDLAVTCDKAALMEYLEKNCTSWDTEMTASEIVTEDGVTKLILGKASEKLNLPGAASALQNSAFSNIGRGEAVIFLPLEINYPPSIPEGYEDMEGIEELVAEAQARAEQEEAQAQEEAQTQEDTQERTEEQTPEETQDTPREGTAEAPADAPAEDE